jgi:pre-rRNA-processing protein TSR3
MSFVVIHSDGEESESSGGDASPLPATTGPRCRQVVLFEYKQNDPKRDTGMKLVRKGLARSLHPGAPFKGIVLSAQGRSVLSAADAALITTAGIAAVNCSWNRLDEIGNTPGGNLGRHRKLPFLVAANPINYGKAFKLSTAEAIAGGLMIAGFADDAYRLTEKFSWHDEFWRLNSDMFEAYSKCQSSREIIQVQDMFMAPVERVSVGYDEIGLEEKDTRESLKKSVSFSTELAAVREFIKGDPPGSPPPVVVPVITETEVPVPTFPSEAPKDQRNCLIFLSKLPIDLGIQKNATGNALAKMKRKEYLEIWSRFVADDANVKYVTDVELVCKK